MTSPSYTSFVSLIRSPMALDNYIHRVCLGTNYNGFLESHLLKFSMRTSVFFISELNTSDPTMGQNGTFEPSSCAMARAIAVFPGEKRTRIRYSCMIVS